MQQNDKVALIIGYGSIGARHAALLADMGYSPVCVTHRKDVTWPVFADTAAALAVVQPQIVVIATRTVDHLANYNTITSTGYAGCILIEKPIFAQVPQCVPAYHNRIFVGYNLRYHPVVQAIRAHLEGKKIFAAQFSVGQYLPQWRPGTNYRHSYSAHAAEGGGVLRDLSHELDLAQWLCGPLSDVAASVSHNQNLEIETEDTVDILSTGSKGTSVSIHLDYQNLVAHRTVSVQAEGTSLFGDLVQSTLRTPEGTENFKMDRNTTYRTQWQDILTSPHPSACTFTEGLSVMRLIHAVESAAAAHAWERV